MRKISQQLHYTLNFVARWQAAHLCELSSWRQQPSLPSLPPSTHHNATVIISTHPNAT